MTKIGELIVGIGADASGFQSELTKVQQQVGGLGTAMKGLPLLAIAGAFTGLGVAILKVGTDFDDAFDTIRIGTGATGEALEGLQADFRAVVADVPTDFASAGQAITDLNRRLGLTGEELQELASQFLELSRITKTDLAANITTLTRVFGDWSIATDKQSEALDYLFRVSQRMGPTVEEIGRLIVQYGAPLRMLGFSYEEAAVMLAKWMKEGVNAELVLGSLRIAIGKMAEANIPLREGLDAVIKRIQDLGPGAEATALGMEIFGARAGPDMVAAILEGRFELGNLVEDLSNADETILGAAADTKDFGEKLTILGNRAKLAAEPIGVTLVNALGGLMDMLDKVGESWRTSGLIQVWDWYVDQHGKLRAYAIEQGWITKKQTSAIDKLADEYEAAMKANDALAKATTTQTRATVSSADAIVRVNQILAAGKETTKAAADAYQQAGISIQDMASAYAAAATQFLTLRLVGLRDQFAAVNAAIEANAAEQRGLQDVIAATRERINSLSSALSEAKSRFQDLANVRLTGMGALDDQIFAIEQNIKRLQYVAAGGILPAGMVLPTGMLAELEKQLTQLQLLRQISFEPQLRVLAAAAVPPLPEMTFAAAMAAISATKASIASLEGQIVSANAVLASQEANLRAVQAAADDLKASAAMLQQQIAATEQTQKMMTDTIIRAIVWILDESAKMKAFGGTVAVQAGIVDAETTKMLKTFADFSLGHSSTTIADVKAAVKAWQDARDEIDRIAAQIKGISIPGAPAARAPVVSTPVVNAAQNVREVFMSAGGEYWTRPVGGQAPPAGYEYAYPEAFQHGGIVTRPTLAMLGEAGPEAVVPLGGGGFGGSINLRGDVYLDSQKIGEVVWSDLKGRKLRGTVLGLS